MAKKTTNNAEATIPQAEAAPQTEAAPEVKTTEQTEAAPEAANANEPTYKVSEFVEAAQRIFNVMPECVAAALTKAGKTELTLTEAKKIVGAFMKKEVK